MSTETRAPQKRDKQSRATKVCTREIRGTSVDVFVTPDGHFCADLTDQLVTGITLDALVQKLDKALQKQRVKVEIQVAIGHYGDRPRNVVLTGIHAGTGAVLMRTGDGRSEQLASYSSVEVYSPFSAEDVKAYDKLSLAIELAENERRAFLAQRKIKEKPLTLVENAIRKAEGR